MRSCERGIKQGVGRLSKGVVLVLALMLRVRERILKHTRLATLANPKLICYAETY
jgi:hypothetical protein